MDSIELTKRDRAEETFTAVKIDEPKGQNETIDSGTQAHRVLEHRAASVQEEVSSALVFSQGLTAFEKDTGELERFLQELADKKVLTQSEVKKGLTLKSEGTASKLKKIADNRALIFHPKIIQFLHAGYSVLYELVLLSEELETDPLAAVDRLHAILKLHDGPITRDFLKNERQKLRPAQIASETETEEGHEKAGLTDDHRAAERQGSIAATDENGEVRNTSQEGSGAAAARLPAGNHVARAELDGDTTPPSAIEQERLVTAVLLTPNDNDTSRLLNGEGLPILAQIKEQIAADATLLVCTKLSQLSSFSKVIAALGFERCARVHLLKQPGGPNITDNAVLVGFVRGLGKIVDYEPDWKHANQVVKVTDHLLREIAGRRVHLFAKSLSSGWDSLKSDKVWAGGIDSF